MFENEPYRFLATGHLEDIDSINAQNLVQTYQDLLEENAISTYIIGNVDLEEVKSLCKNILLLNIIIKWKLKHL